MIDWSLAIKIIVTGIVLVITIISGLAGIMVLIGRAHDRGIKGVFKREAPAEEVSEEELSSDEAAAILGAVLEHMEVTKEKASLQKTKKWVLDGRESLMKTLDRETPNWEDEDSMWKLSGRRELMNSKTNNSIAG